MNVSYRELIVKTADQLLIRNIPSRRVQQTVLRYFKRVAIFSDKNTQIEASMTLFAFVVLISQFIKKKMFSIEMDPRM